MNDENLYYLLKECTENLYAIADRLSYGESSKHPTVAEEIHIAGENANEALNGIKDDLDEVSEKLDNLSDNISEKLDDLNDNISKIADALERMIP